MYISASEVLLYNNIFIIIPKVPKAEFSQGRLGDGFWKDRQCLFDISSFMSCYWRISLLRLGVVERATTDAAQASWVPAQPALWAKMIVFVGGSGDGGFLFLFLNALQALLG